MIDTLLVRHPSPDPSESLPGYVLRLSEANGYGSMYPLFRLAGIEHNEGAWKTFAHNKLARLASCSPEVIERIALRRPDGNERTWEVLGNKVRIVDLALTHARVCPECVKGLGFVEAQWQIGLFVGCPRHGKIATYFCTACRKRLTWDRQGLLRCRCGASISDLNQRSLSQDEIAVLSLLRAKVLGEPPPAPDAGTELPLLALATFNLEDLLTLIRFLGTKRLEGDHKSKPHFDKDAFKEAAKVLARWPIGLQKLLKDLCPGLGPVEMPCGMPGLRAIQDVVWMAEMARYKRKSLAEALLFIQQTLSLSVVIT